MRKSRGLLASSLVLASLGHAGAPPVVVHEWGTFTSVAGEDGRPVAWRALAQPWELPSFVYRDDAATLPSVTTRPGCIKATLRGLVRLETPVAYVYAPEPTRLSFRVDFRDGRLTEWYPAAALRPGRLTWGDVEVLPGSPATLPTDGSESHYYAARVPAAAPLRVPSEAGQDTESFLFYRGVGQWELPLLATLAGERLHLTALVANLGRVLVFEAREGRAAWRAVDLGNGSTRAPRPSSGDVEGARSALLSLLVENGLFAEEAEAMLRTWDDSWFEEGLRVFFVLPPSMVDAVLPLRIRPAPAELRRVFVGRLEVLTPERVQWAEERLTAVGAGAPGEEALHTLGRFAEPLLLRIREAGADPNLRQRSAELLAANDPPPQQTSQR